MKIHAISAIACLLVIATGQASASSQAANQRSLKVLGEISQLLDQGGLRNLDAAEALFATKFTLQTTARIIHGKPVVTGIVLMPQSAITTLPHEFLYTWILPDPIGEPRKSEVSAQLILDFNRGQCLSSEQITRAFGANYISRDEGLTRFLTPKASAANGPFNDTISACVDGPYDARAMRHFGAAVGCGHVSGLLTRLS